MSKATIKDVARQAGVSLKTVSRVINNEPTVRTETREKVQEAINNLGYQPDMAARNLRGATSYAVGLVYDNPNPYYVVDIQQGVLKCCRELGYGLQIHPCDAASPQLIDELADLVLHSRLAGLVLAPPISENDDIVQALADRGIHVVRIVSGAEAPGGPAPAVHVNDRAAAYALTDHLIELGHRRIAFLSGEEEHRSTPERRAGYEAALRAHGLPVDPALILPGRYTFDSGFNRTQALLAGPDRPTAIFGCNDEIAAGALAATRANGMTVPGDLSIAGFEDSPFSRQSSPPLTTAAQKTEAIARQAMLRLIGAMRPHTTEDMGAGPEADVFVPNLIVRPSTGPVTRR